MRIAYIAPYQGPALSQRRPTLLNLSLAGNIKIELIAGILEGSGHDVEILSQGEVVERSLRYYPAFSEPSPVRRKIPVHYSSALPVRFVNGVWSSLRTLALFKTRHAESQYDLVIVYNLKLPQMICASHAIRRLNLPVILEYEDDAIVDVNGRSEGGVLSRCYRLFATRTSGSISGCVCVSPHLMSRLPPSVPRLLLRGVVGEDLVASGRQAKDGKRNWVLFSGTHYRSKGLEQLIAAWGMVKIPGWELHLTGHGELTARLRQMASGSPDIVFHGLVERPELVRLMCSAKICINPHDPSTTPGNVFAFKIVEYLAAGAHVVTTPMGELEKEVEAGITYLPDNSPESIAATLGQVVANRKWEQTAAQFVAENYGSPAVTKSLEILLAQVMERRSLAREAGVKPSEDPREFMGPVR